MMTFPWVFTTHHYLYGKGPEPGGHREPRRQEGHISFTPVTLPITGSGWIVIRI